MIEEIRHLRRNAAEARARADDDGIVIRKILDLCDRRSLINLVVRSLRHLGGHELRHALDIDSRAGFAGSFGNSVRHRFDMAVSRVIKNENLGHCSLHLRIGDFGCDARERCLRFIRRHGWTYMQVTTENWGSGGVDHHDLGIFERSDGQFCFISNGETITRVGANTVDF